MLLKSQFGSVKPYTRHVASCSQKDDPDHNDCQCPKWLYEYKRGGKPARRSLVTPSWAEAQQIASDALRGFDPEIAEKRAQDQKRERQRVTVEAACQRWLDDVKKKNGTEGVWPTYRSLTRKFTDWATRNNVLYIQEVTTSALDAWSSSPEWTHNLSRTTQRQRWANLRAMFNYLASAKVIEDDPIRSIRPIRADGDPVQGPYTDEQIAAMFAHVADSLEGDPDTRALRARRLHAMLTLLLNVGCDLIDAAQFEPRLLERMRIDERDIWVYQYDRDKTGNRAVVPLTDQVVETLQNVPLLPENSPEMPFRSRATNPKTDSRFWGHRIYRLLKVAGVKHVTLPATGRRKERLRPANAKQLRHTFAVRHLIAGQRPEAVARMLGHVDAAMVRKHYAPFIPELKEAHVRLVVQGWR